MSKDHYAADGVPAGSFREEAWHRWTSPRVASAGEVAGATPHRVRSTVQVPGSEDIFRNIPAAPWVGPGMSTDHEYIAWFADDPSSVQVHISSSPDVAARRQVADVRAVDGTVKLVTVVRADGCEPLVTLSVQISLHVAEQ